MLNQKPSLMWSQKKLSVVLSQKKLSLMFENTMTLIPVEWDGELDCNAEISKQLQQHFFCRHSNNIADEGDWNYPSGFKIFINNIIPSLYAL
jgi:hypothetical protein